MSTGQGKEQGTRHKCFVLPFKYVFHSLFGGSDLSSKECSHYDSYAYVDMANKKIVYPFLVSIKTGKNSISIVLTR